MFGLVKKKKKKKISVQAIVLGNFKNKLKLLDTFPCLSVC